MSRVIEKVYPYTWAWAKWPRDSWDKEQPGRYKGMPCRVLASDRRIGNCILGYDADAPRGRGTINHMRPVPPTPTPQRGTGAHNKAAVEFLDGFKVIVSRNGLRRADHPLTTRLELVGAAALDILEPGLLVTSPGGLRCVVLRKGMERGTVRLRQVHRYSTAECRWYRASPYEWDWQPMGAWQTWRASMELEGRSTTFSPLHDPHALTGHTPLT